MKVVSLKITNFRSIKSAEFKFDGHCLLVGPNNVGKSTICEALDLVLGPDRISRFPPVEEFDFHNAMYLEPAAIEGEAPTAVPIRIEVVLTNINAEVEIRCGQHLEFWNTVERRLLNEGEVDQANPPVVTCLRLETKAVYNPEEDEFEAQTYYSHSPNAEQGELARVSKDVKRMFGFLYLRAVRTGSRALSLERGSLLDVILRLRGSRAGLWEKAIERLRGLDIEKDATHLDPVLKSIEERLGKYIASDVEGRTTKLHVSQLTREHLRKTMAFFLAMSKDQTPVPFQQVGTGTLNVLVLALLSFIAELKPASVIFAMEEPEIAVPPHTQRRIADYLLGSTTQAFVTSHSPFVIERFEPEQTLLLSRGPGCSVEAKKVSDAGGSLKGNDFKRYARRGLTECMLGKGAIVVEGLTEFHALPAAARIMELSDPDLQPLDIAGTAFFDAESEGNMPKFGNFFKALGLKTFSFYDFLVRPPAKKQLLIDAFDVDWEHPYVGFEDLVVQEVPVDRMWAFLEDLRNTGDSGGFLVPAERPSDADVKTLLSSALKGQKGAGWAARLFEGCAVHELPVSVTEFLKKVYAAFPKPVAPEAELDPVVAEEVALGPELA
jgi:putative ATP-dependent endonuclease of OLD family